jgi:DNA (cytosine-5)-methyltransferase 1
MAEIINAADLFCGGGGTSNGLYDACYELGYHLDLVAVNHWHIALKTHRENHPEARHIWADLSSLNPREVIKGKKLNLLIASPECIYHSNARGGKPIKEQLRASAWCVLRWAEALLPDDILIENVQEFRKWGPVGFDNKPIKDRGGETYEAYINALRSLGYTVEDRVLNTADYGDPTSRERLFIMAKRGNHKQLKWPEATHTETGDELAKWVPAKQIIDWNIKGKSIFNRKRPLADATKRRIAAGLKKFCGDMAEPFLVMLYGSNDARSINRPLPTITAGGNHIGLCEPFIVIEKGKSTVRKIDKPIPTITTQPHLYLCEPFIINYYGNSNFTEINKPLPTVTTKDRFGLVEPLKLDILFRMLQPHELAAGMSFPDNYKFFGSRADIIKQIGNAVPRRTAKALCKTLLAA